MKKMKPGDKAIIKGDHPHSGELATFIQARMANFIGPGFVFANEQGIEFFVFDIKKNVKWI